MYVCACRVRCSYAGVVGPGDSDLALQGRGGDGQGVGRQGEGLFGHQKSVQAHGTLLGAHVADGGGAGCPQECVDGVSGDEPVDHGPGCDRVVRAGHEEHDEPYGVRSGDLHLGCEHRPGPAVGHVGENDRHGDQGDDHRGDENVPSAQVLVVQHPVYASQQCRPQCPAERAPGDNRACEARGSVRFRSGVFRLSRACWAFPVPHYQLARPRWYGRCQMVSSMRSRHSRGTTF